MGMSSWIMDLEDKYWDTVATIVSESETFQEAESSAKSLAKTEVPFLDHFINIFDIFIVFVRSILLNHQNSIFPHQKIRMT